MLKIRVLLVHLRLGLLNEGFSLTLIRFRYAHTHKQTDKYPTNTRTGYYKPTYCYIFRFVLFHAQVEKRRQSAQLYRH